MTDVLVDPPPAGVAPGKPPVRPRGRPRVVRAAVVRDVRAIGLHHFAFLRASILGLDLFNLVNVYGHRWFGQVLGLGPPARAAAVRFLRAVVEGMSTAPAAPGYFGGDSPSEAREAHHDVADGLRADALRQGGATFRYLRSRGSAVSLDAQAKLEQEIAEYEQRMLETVAVVSVPAVVARLLSKEAVTATLKGEMVAGLQAAR